MLNAGEEDPMVIPLTDGNLCLPGFFIWAIFNSEKLYENFKVEPDRAYSLWELKNFLLSLGYDIKNEKSVKQQISDHLHDRRMDRYILKDREYRHTEDGKFVKMKTYQFAPVCKDIFEFLSKQREIITEGVIKDQK